MRLRWILPVLAIAAAVAVYRLWRFGEQRSPEALLASAREQMDVVEPDLQTVTRELGRALVLARERGDETIEEQILRLRADVNRRNDALLNALADYQVLLERFAPKEIDLLRVAGSTALAALELDTARELADRWIALEPESAGPRIQRGEIEVRRGERELESFGERLRRDLAPRAADAAQRNAARIVYLPPRSVRRAAPFGQLLAQRPAATREADLADLIHISATLELARDDFTESLVRAPNTYSLAFLQLLLRRAQLHEQAGLLGQFALGLPQFDVRQDALCETTVNLTLAERADLARSAWRRGYERLDRKVALAALQPEQTFLLEGVLARLGEWDVLEEAAEGLDWLAAFLEVPVAKTYREGSLLIVNGEREAGLAKLSTIAPGDPEYFEGSTLQAYLVQDDALRPDDPAGFHVWSILVRLGEEVAPDDPLAPRIGRAWGNLAELFRSRGDGTSGEYALGRALSLLGEDPELVSRWEEAGLASQRARGIDAAKVIAEMRFDPACLSSGQYTLYDAWSAARELYGEQDIPLARNALTYLRRTLPDLPQALLLDGWVELALRSPERAAADWARRLEIGGQGVEPCWDALGHLPWDDIPSETRLRLLRASPDHFGPFVRLRELARTGREAEAIAWFERRDPATLGDALRVEAGILYAATEQWDKARAVLAALPADGQGAVRTAGLNQPTHIHTPGGVAGKDLTRVARARPDDPDLVRALDELFAEGRLAEARAVLSPLLSDAKMRSPALVERFLAALLAETGSLLAQLGELRASVDDQGAGLLLLASAFDASKQDELEREARTLSLQFTGGSPYALALCKLLSDDFQDAALLLESIAGTTFGIDEAKRALAAGLASALTTPPGDVPELESPVALRLDTFLVIALLALERPSVVPWALQRLRSLPPPLRDDRRVHLIEALCLAELGASERAEALCVPLCESGADEAWLLREALAEKRLGGTSAAFREVRERRLTTFGTRGLRPEDLALYQSRSAEGQGNVPRALAILDLYLRYGDASELLAERARLLELSAGPLAPLEDYHRLFAALPAERAGALVPHYLELLHRAQEAGQLTPGALRTYVEALCVDLPDEPAAVIELAWLAAGEGTQAGLSRAWDLLDAFLRENPLPERRFRTQDESRWLDLFLRYDPERAVRFAELQLMRRPESPEMWSAWTRTLHAAGRFVRAYREQAVFVRFHPEASELQWVPWYACDAGVPPDELELLVSQAEEALSSTPAGAGTSSPAVVRALAAFDRSEELGPDMLALLEQAWNEPATGAEHRDRMRIAVAYALALVGQGSPEAAARARDVLARLRDESTEEVDVRLADLLLALAPR